MYIALRDIATGKFLVQPLQCWAESTHPDWNRVKSSEKLGGTNRDNSLQDLYTLTLAEALDSNSSLINYKLL